MRIGFFLAISAISMIANAGGAVVSGGRGPIRSFLYCSQNDNEVPSFEIVVDTDFVGRLNFGDGQGNQLEYRLSCEKAEDQTDDVIFCEHKNYYSIYIKNYVEALVINNRGSMKKIDCQIK